MLSMAFGSTVLFQAITIRHGEENRFARNREEEEPRKEEEMTTRRLPMGRVAEPDEIKGIAVYLASDASSFVTGQVFVQDGGYTI